MILAFGNLLEDAVCMTRGVALSIMLSLRVMAPVWGQSIAIDRDVAAQKQFVREVDALGTRVVNNEPIDPLVRLQEETGLSASSAEEVFGTVRAYSSGADRIDAALRRSILNRRLQVAGEFRVMYSPELDMVNSANLNLNLFLLEEMPALHSRLGEVESGKLKRFLEQRAPLEAFFPLREGEVGITPRRDTGWKQSPLGFWRDAVKGPLSRPDAEELFAQYYKDAVLPSMDTGYLEGTVVDVTTDESGARRVLLSMQEGAPAEAALLIDGVNWKLRREPVKGTVVRFSGVAREFGQEPFWILLAPERITGLAVDSLGPNPPFTVPGLAR